MNGDVDPAARAIAQFVLAELRSAGEALLRMQHQIETLAQAEDLRAALREQILVDPVFAHAMTEAGRRANVARGVFPSEDDVEVAAIALWENTYRQGSWADAAEILKQRPRSDARAALEAMRGRIPARP